MKSTLSFPVTWKIILPFLVVCFTLSGIAAHAQNIGGIGAQLFLDTAGDFTMPRILRLVPNTPADTTLKATDFIIKVNDVSCKDKSIDDVVGLIRGEVGTTVKITVADTKEGKRKREYTLPRVAIQGAAPIDPLMAFNNYCDNEVMQLRKKHLEIIKTYTSDCGNYYFNFNAEAHTYHIRLFTMEEKASSAFTPGFSPSARVFDGDNEGTAIALNKIDPKESGNMFIAQLEGTISFSKTAVGVISVKISDDVKKCKSMYVVVYK